jgi:hypothetical protein
MPLCQHEKCRSNVVPHRPRRKVSVRAGVDMRRWVPGLARMLAVFAQAEIPRTHSTHCYSLQQSGCVNAGGKVDQRMLLAARFAWPTASRGLRHACLSSVSVVHHWRRANMLLPFSSFGLDPMETFVVCCPPFALCIVALRLSSALPKILAIARRPGPRDDYCPNGGDSNELTRLWCTHSPRAR